MNHSAGTINAQAGPSSPKPKLTQADGASVKAKQTASADGRTAAESKAKKAESDSASLLSKYSKPKVASGPSEAEKRAQAVAKAKAFEDRFKKRGKRPPPTDEEEPKWKKPKVELSEYEKEVQKYEARVLGDTGSGVRAHMK